MNLAEKLSEYSYCLSYREIPREVVHEVKRRLIDSLGCAVAAFSSVPAQMARQVIWEFPSKKGSTLFGTRFRTSPEAAAFYNGLLIRYLDYNDTYLSKEPAHPSDNFSAALAMGEDLHSSGKDFITAVVLGYEVQCRLCDAASIRARGWDHVTYGAFSTALVAAKLMHLSEKKTYHAVNLAGVANITLRQTRVGELSMWKGCAFANAARNGLFAARLASRGMTGPAPIFEGRFGLFHLVSGPFKIKKWGGKRERFKILDTAIKYFPVEYHAQSAVEAALELRKEILNIDEIRSIHVKTFKAAIEIIAGEREKWHPVSRETADHSLPYCVAVALMDGKMELEQFSLRKIQDEKLHNLILKVKVEEDLGLTRLYPKAVPISLKIVLKNGHILKKEILHSKGYAARPLTDLEVEEKFKNLTRKIFSPNQQKHILNQLWNLEKMEDVGAILRLFRNLKIKNQRSK
ncbi:MAG: MmgE/PrpD family protein [Chlamydiae bacterium]|nr:MmgE/PrpD family protein [Chlamydiota bacterium]MBI3276174.1 MmgE/PrpD family protein [Chlamydiota bacterium]